MNPNVLSISTSSNTQKNIMFCCIISIIICFFIYRLLKNRTVEIEKFSNDPVIYSANGSTLQ